MSLPHNKAQVLESLVRKAYHCGYHGISGLVTADHFGTCPLDAAVMIISSLYTTNKVTDHEAFKDFISRYDVVFSYPEHNLITDEIIENYIFELDEIVSKYY